MLVGGALREGDRGIDRVGKIEGPIWGETPYCGIGHE